jgi:uroporphyrinogen-III synthase
MRDLLCVRATLLVLLGHRHWGERGASVQRAQSADLSIAPLAGYTVAVAADRRRHPIAAMFESIGARTISVQAVRTVAQPDEDAVRAATAEVVARPVHEVVVSSAFGLRSWLAVARRSGGTEALLARFADARLLARDARAADGLRDLGLTQIWSTAGATTEDLFRYLIAQPMVGRRVVAQLDAEPLRELCDTLRAAGADVVEVTAFRSDPPSHVDVLRRLGDQVAKRQVDAVAFTSRSTVAYLLDQAAADGNTDDVLNAFVSDVVAVCLGQLAAQPLLARGVTPLVAPAPYAEDLLALLAVAVPERALRLSLGGVRVEVRGQALLVGGRLVPVQPGPIAVLRALARHPGRVLSAGEIRGLVPGWAGVDDHAIEMAVSRLRRSLDGTDLDGTGLVQTVMKRGYRLAT